MNVDLKYATVGHSSDEGGFSTVQHLRSLYARIKIYFKLLTGLHKDYTESTTSLINLKFKSNIFL